MPELRGTYGTTYMRNEYSAWTVFAFHTKDPSVPAQKHGWIKCCGYLPMYPSGTPLKLTFQGDRFLNPELEYECIVDECSIDTSQQAEAAAFLDSEKLPGLGKARSEELTRRYPDLRALLRQEDAKERLMQLRLNDYEATQLIQRMSVLFLTEDIYHEIFPYGGTPKMASDIANRYREKSPELLRKDPFVFHALRVPFRILDHLAKQAQLSPFMQSRLEALADEVLEHAEALGHTKISIGDFFRQARYVEFQAGTGYETSPMHFVRALFAKQFVMYQENGIYYVYRKQTFRKEQQIAEDLVRIGHAERDRKVSDVMIREAEQAFDIRYSAEQKEAFRLLDTSGIKILTGGPGTGKTTVIRGLIRVFRTMYPDKTIALCAPTGCAAKRMREATGETAQTIHKLLDVRPMGGGETMQMKDEYERLDVDLLIVDESSMMGADLCSRLLSAVPDTATVLLSGDEEQLPSVDCGNVLRDLIRSGKADTCRLYQIYRQQDGSDLAENAGRIREGSAALSVSDSFRIIECATETEMLETVLKCYKEEAKEKGIMNIRVFTPVKRAEYLLGTANLNQMIRKMRGEAKEPECLYRLKRFRTGDIVLFTRNNYATGYLNGDIGVIRRITQDGGRSVMSVETDEDLLEISGPDLEDVELGYALTVHKAQGSECESAIICLPPEPAHMLTKSLLYVAATRAKRKNIIVTMPGMLQKALRNTGDRKRNTGLLFRMAEHGTS